MIRKGTIFSSFLLMVIIVILWVGSYFRTINLGHYYTDSSFIYMISDVGHVAISVDDRLRKGTNRWIPDWSAPAGCAVIVKSRELFLDHYLWGFGYAWAKPIFAGRRQTTYVLMFPHWFLVLILAIYPFNAFIRGPYRRHRRRKKGLCLTCGYNLEGNVSGVCPECGEQI